MKSYLFAYGTLLPGHAPGEITASVDRLRSIGRGRIRGRLYDLGEYPGAILDAAADTAVSGVVLELPQDPAVLRSLDEYEGYDPADPDASLFVRKNCPIELFDGRELQCWVYVYNRDPGEAPLVSSGDYAPLRPNGRT